MRLFFPFLSEAYRSSQIIFWVTDQTHSQRQVCRKGQYLDKEDVKNRSRLSTRVLREQATCRRPFSGPLLRPVSCGWVAASGS